jgi:hypothetical protein
MQLQTLFHDKKLWTFSETENIFFKDLVRRENSPQKLFVLCVNVQTSTIFSIWWRKCDIPWGQMTDLTYITEKVQLTNPNDKTVCVNVNGENLETFFAKRRRVATNYLFTNLYNCLLCSDNKVISIHSTKPAPYPYGRLLLCPFYSSWTAEVLVMQTGRST